MQQTYKPNTSALKDGAPKATVDQKQLLPCKYRVGRVLGGGTYATVREAVHIETNKMYAAKIMNKKMMEKKQDFVKNEIAILKRVSYEHPNILHLVDFFETVNNLYLITELATGGELFDRICAKGSFYEADAAALMRTTTSAVKYLHDNGIVHRDLKPENLLYRSKDPNSDLLIADFGLSHFYEDSQYYMLMTACGTPEYMAPEVFRRTGYGKPVDMWAIGVITYFLLSGYTPFARPSQVEVIEAILANEYTFNDPCWSGISETAKDFIKKCLENDPSKRLTAADALKHPFLSEKRPATSNLLPNVRENFNARKTFRTAYNAVRAFNTWKKLENKH
ncbi:calcium/calmodulin-dependent protein kinase Cmk1 [Schizosaccharomyces pombe]|uniref:Calcium/calmodulin-dependent protein kinase type I n=1 Tax=Schizosaccharomyces pombe (strain 972 / ATCC 24843) TaxID=284812 RepID=KCC1_SCHPO|nr:calcium/calmodulin-dependent protein kinase Cmk1 [Schizosaccharomyces pombe]Q9P7I2.1 RecName: Full=Calcium/calmodulin-dependent protein kinase type I; Short=CaMK-I [Schizosaccharomyces pombe 972h-]CAB76233.1 calcium/calmodulin-dependent protein kinase Cmk1 [Schizosaccharomyces pombe]|eukprot:NP_593464.1 calcium/calmodulin-dependent protein kinase Cmk1 [Schizosaccharomyces pombe]